MPSRQKNKKLFFKTRCDECRLHCHSHQSTWSERISFWTCNSNKHKRKKTHAKQVAMRSVAFFFVASHNCSEQKI
jgi:hypothetical protein